jgi:hypothetical protein
VIRVDSSENVAKDYGVVGGHLQFAAGEDAGGVAILIGNAAVQSTALRFADQTRPDKKLQTERCTNLIFIKSKSRLSYFNYLKFSIFTRKAIK